MKKIFNHIFIFTSIILMSACNTLDVDNLDSYNEDRVWSDKNLVEAYVVNLYASTFPNWNVSADQSSQQLTGIFFYPDRITISNGNNKNWNYDLIYKINNGLVKVEQGSLSTNEKNSLKAQMLFLRAYTYFGMVVYHGGVPYHKKPLEKDDPNLYSKRNTTAECFDYIINDIDEALKYWTTSTSSIEYGRIEGNFALAFKAKVLLQKASPQFNPKTPYTNSYWNEAYTVNKKAYDSLKANGYSLTPDYSNMFLKERGPEVVFAVINSYPNKVANWDNGARPGSESRGNAWATPTWEFVKEFPMKDGKLYNDPTSNYYKTDEQFLKSYWENRDPRFGKSIVWNGAKYPVSGKVDKRQYTALGVADVLDDFGTNPAAQRNSTNLDRYSGFFILKACDLSLKQSEVQRYDIDYVVMRFAEVMLNYAETANETGKFAEALDIMKQIRQRAGIEPGDDNNYGITAKTRAEMRDAILAERNIEFCFEDKRFWDLRRCRRFDLIDGKTKHGVEAIAINADGTDMTMQTASDKASKYELVETDFRYLIHQVPTTGVKECSVPDTYYFFPIQKTVLDRNSKLEQNNNWGGTFNPALE